MNIDFTQLAAFITQVTAATAHPQQSAEELKKQQEFTNKAKQAQMSRLLGMASNISDSLQGPDSVYSEYGQASIAASFVYHATTSLALQREHFKARNRSELAAIKARQLSDARATRTGLESKLLELPKLEDQASLNSAVADLLGAYALAHMHEAENALIDLQGTDYQLTRNDEWLADRLTLDMDLSEDAYSKYLEANEARYAARRKEESNSNRLAQRASYLIQAPPAREQDPNDELPANL